MEADINGEDDNADDENDDDDGDEIVFTADLVVMVTLDIALQTVVQVVLLVVVYGE